MGVIGKDMRTRWVDEYMIMDSEEWKERIRVADSTCMEWDEDKEGDLLKYKSYKM